MLMIRLQRVGRRNHAEFRVVVTEHTRGPKSKNVREVVGVYNPHTDIVSLKKERIRYWMGVGAQVSDTVHNILISQGVIEGKKRNALPRKTPPVTVNKSASGASSSATEEASVAERVA